MNNTRKTIRLANRDYSWKGRYFVTICTWKHECYLGEITNGSMVLSPVGKVVWDFWMQIPGHYLNVTLGPFVVMPNHVHGVISINENKSINSVRPCRGMALQKMGTDYLGLTLNHFSKPVSGSVSMIMNHLKGTVTRWCNKNGHRYFAWQKRFYDHVITSEEDYLRIEKYIIENPINWDTDDYNKKNA